MVSQCSVSAAPDCNLKFVVRSTDGGEFNSDYSCHNVLQEDTSCYCSISRENVNLVMQHQGRAPYTATSIVVAAPSSGFTSPIGQGMVFCTWDEPTVEFIQATKAWDGVTSRAEFDRMLQWHINKGEADPEQLPVAFFDVSRTTRGVFPLDVPRSGRYVVVKLVRAITGDNIDVQYIGFRGWSRPQTFASTSYC